MLRQSGEICLVSPPPAYLEAEGHSRTQVPQNKLTICKVGCCIYPYTIISSRHWSCEWRSYISTFPRRALKSTSWHRGLSSASSWRVANNISWPAFHHTYTSTWRRRRHCIITRITLPGSSGRDLHYFVMASLEGMNLYRPTLKYLI